MKNSKSRSKTNFNNPKVKSVIRSMEISENRLSRSDIIDISNKDILYQLRNEGYIKETNKGYYKATKKLKAKMEKDYGEAFGSSSSKEHSHKVYQSTKLLPKNIITERNFKTGQELEKAFKVHQKSNTYKRAYKERLSHLITSKEKLGEYHKQIQRSDLYKVAKLQENIDYRAKYDDLKRSIGILKGSACNVPDYSFTCSYENSITYLNQLKEYKNSLDENTKESFIYQEAIEKVNHILTSYESDQSITWSIEVITNSYASIDIERHHNYEILTGQPVIYLM